MATALAIVSLGAQVFGTIAQSNAQADAAAAARQQAKAKQAELNYQAQQAEVKAGQEQATSQRAAIQQRRNADLAISRARAVAASSGGGADDPTVNTIIGKLAGEGEYRALTALYQGEDAASALQQSALLRRYEGQNALIEGNAKADALDSQSRNTLFTGLGSTITSKGATTLYSKYG